MRNPLDWVKRMLAEKPEQPSVPESLIQVGIIRRGADLRLCPVHSEERGVKVVTLPLSLVQQYERVIEEYWFVQARLTAYPVSLRKRKARKAKMPDLET